MLFTPTIRSVARGGRRSVVEGEVAESAEVEDRLELLGRDHDVESLRWASKEGWEPAGGGESGEGCAVPRGEQVLALESPSWG